MRSTDRPGKQGRSELLRVESLDVFYGQAHAVQSASLALETGVLAVVGRNGMGKSTLCKAIVGMVPARGSVTLAGRQLLGLSPEEITHLGVAYVPQGRRVWRSLSVDETLRLSAKTARSGEWTVDRVYETFPRLAERRSNGGAQLSGGEQQMLAIGRALLFNPRLMIMDEPTEGLAPVIVEQVATLLKTLAAERKMAILLVEQNLGVALEVADRVAIMVNGRIARNMEAQVLAEDRELQQRLLGMRTADGADESDDADAPAAAATSSAVPVLRLVRAHGSAADSHADRPAIAAADVAQPREVAVAAEPVTRSLQRSGPTLQQRVVYLAGCWQPHSRELASARKYLESFGARVATVELADNRLSPAQIDLQEMARHRVAPAGSGVSTPRDAARLFADYMGSRKDVAGLMVLGNADVFDIGRLGALALPVGTPKFILSEGSSSAAGGDICQINVPLSGLNQVNETLIAQAAAALAAMSRERIGHHVGGKPLVCITSLDLVGAVTRNIRKALGDACDTLMLDMAISDTDRLARLAGSGLVAGVIDVAPVDMTRGLLAGQTRAIERRFEALRDHQVPYVLVPSLLAWANFPSGEPVPGAFLQRDVSTTALDGSLVPLERGETERLIDVLTAALDRANAPARVMLPRAVPAGESYAPALPATPLVNEVARVLARRVRTGRHLQLSEWPEGLKDLRFGEAVGLAMRNLIANRAAA